MLYNSVSNLLFLGSSGERVLHRERLAERVARKILKSRAHDVRRTRLDPLTSTVHLILVATLKEPVTNVVTVERERIEDVMAGTIAVRVLGVNLRANSREEHVSTLLDAFQNEDTSLARRKGILTFLSMDG
jgi:hypothetical protein